MSMITSNLKAQEEDGSDEYESVSNSAGTKKNNKQQRRGSIRDYKETLPPRTIDSEQEEEIIRILEV